MTASASLPAMDVHDQMHRNESIADASGITKETGNFERIFSIHDGSDVDYYKITLVNDGTAQNFLSIDFDGSLGELELGLYAEDNSLVLSSSAIESGRLLNLDGLAAGDYYVRINGVGQAVNSYGLQWDLKNYGIPMDVLDIQNRNESLATATRITREQGPGTELSIHSATDEDYYQLVIAYTGTADNFVQIAFDDAQGSLTLELYDAQGRKVRSASDVSGGRRISLEGLAPGAYYARVYSEEHAQSTYTLSWNQAQRAPLPDDYFDRTKRNDSIATASTLPYTAGYYTGGTNIQLQDADYFKVSLTACGSSGTYFLMNNIDATGSLRADIVNAAGDVLRTSVAWSFNSQKLSFEGLNPGTYYIKVYGETLATTGTYDIKWDFYPGLRTLPEMQRPDMWTADAFEGNDSVSAATTLLGAGGSNAALTIHNAADLDYYRVTLNEAGTAADYLQIAFTAAWGQLDMELVDASGRTVAASVAGSGTRRISLDGLAADTYYLKVHGVSDAHNAYTLTWNRADETASPASATALSSAGSMTAQQLTEADPARYYAFSLTADGTASNYIAVNGTEGMTLTLLDSQERVLLTLDDASRLNLSGLTGGDYYLRVEAPISANGSDARYTLSYDLGASSDAATVAGHDESSLFALNDAGTEYAYLMGYGNVSLSDFSTSSTTGVRLTSTDALYYDAEKSSSNSRDDELCWAGTASNMLVWSGWAEQGIPSATGTAAEDSIFALYHKSFPDSPGRIEDGIRWFFEKNYKTYSNSLTATSGSGNYIGMTATTGLSMTALDSVSSLDSLAAALQRNMAVGLDLGFYSSVSSSSRISGHAVTVWGYTCDITKNQGEAGYYTGLIVSDSDDDKYLSTATQAPDRLNIISISWNEAAQTYYTKYSAGNRVAKLEDFIALTPKEDWPAGAATTAVASLSDTGTGMDALLSGAMQPSAASMRASAELVASSGTDDRSRQTGMLTA
ncbi:MAG TPA: T9SS type A sorting domain-containing protein [Candidatus Desulfovibrio intestinigallinarum]|nr:T9SS type A sorting domain-containing protein [Candidatus Desulfovibrio intestinigallinarum]